MISKVVRGKTFYGACRYVCGDAKRAVILEAEGVRDNDYREMARDFEAQHSLRRSLGKPVFHGILSFYPGEKVQDEMMTQIALSYLKQIGIKDTQYVITKHTDKNHLHIHILANMVNNRGETIKDNYIGLRGKKAAELITIGYGLKEVKGKDVSKTNLQSLNEREATRYKIYSIISGQIPMCRTLDELEEALQKKGIETAYKYNSKKDEKQGVSFSFDHYKFKGSEIDRNFSLRGLQKRLILNKGTQIRIDKEGNVSLIGISKISRSPSQELYVKKKHMININSLLHPEKTNEIQLPILLPKKRRKKKKL